jgi:predicted Rossmann fold flavoprotein
LINELNKNNVDIRLKHRVKKILVKDQKIVGVETNHGNIECSKVILATGGNSYQFTGSTGDGYKLASSIGHTIMPILPALVALRTEEDFPKRLSGLDLKNIRLKFVCGDKKIVSDIGELLFTDFGVSGPLIVTHRGEVVEFLHNGAKVHLYVDIKPGLTEEMLNTKLIREFEENKKKELKNYMRSLFPERFCLEFIKTAGLSEDKVLNNITKVERLKIIQYIKAFPLQIKDFNNFDDAMVTRGGISLKEVDPKTMQSKIIEGLYFAGEVLDVDGDTGGFNLQAAFSTGYVAGISASGKA